MTFGSDVGGLDDIDRRAAMPVLELLEEMQDDPVELSMLAHGAGFNRGVDHALVRDYVRATLEPPLRSGLIRPLHFYGTARAPFLTDALSVDQVLELVASSLEELSDDSFDPLDLDFWFESTEAGDEAWSDYS